MKADGLSIEVQAKVTVSDETAERCFRLLEMWLNDNPDADIICEKEPKKDGVSHKLRIERQNVASVIFKTMNEHGENQCE